MLPGSRSVERPRLWTGSPCSGGGADLGGAGRGPATPATRAGSVPRRMSCFSSWDRTCSRPGTGRRRSAAWPPWGVLAAGRRTRWRPLPGRRKAGEGIFSLVTVVMNPRSSRCPPRSCGGAGPGRGRAYLTEPVIRYILRKGLYGTATDLKHLTPEELRPIALSYLSPSVCPHAAGQHGAGGLPGRKKYGADVTAARIAALLHDCTKKLDLPQQLSLCRHYAILLDEMERNYLKLLPSPRPARRWLRDRFGVSDETHNAIFYHTTGKGGHDPAGEDYLSGGLY